MRVPGVHAQRIAIALQVIGFETVVESLHNRAVPRKVDRRIRADLLGYLARVNEQVAGPRWAHHDRRDLPQEAGEMVVDGIDVFPAELYGPQCEGALLHAAGEHGVPQDARDDQRDVGGRLGLERSQLAGHVAVRRYDRDRPGVDRLALKAHLGDPPPRRVSRSTLVFPDRYQCSTFSRLKLINLPFMFQINTPADSTRGGVGHPGKLVPIECILHRS